MAQVDSKVNDTALGSIEYKNEDVLEPPDAGSIVATGEAVAPEEKAVLRKIDRCLLPLLVFSYMLQFLDKQTLSFASIMGILKDLQLTGTQYSWATSMFYFGYLAFSYPASFLMVRLPLGKYLAVTCVAWAIVLACHAATSNFTGLMVARFCLGITEASMAPGFSLITGMWYTREEQPLRHGVWFLGNSIGLMFGGLIAYGIAHISGGIGSWRWLYIIYGILTVICGGILFIFLPDTPMTARFLSEEDRKHALNRVRRNQTGIKDNHFKKNHVIEVLKDMKTWLLVIFELTSMIPNGALTAYSNIVLTGFGFTLFQVYLITIPVGLLHAIFAVGSTYLCGHFKGIRTIVAPCLSLISLGGCILVRFGPNQGGKLSGIFMLTSFAATFPIMLSMVSSNVAGFTKKSVTSSMIFVSFCVGNIVGPFFFFASEAPGYSTGFAITAVCFAVAALSMVALRFLLIYENKRRDKLQRDGHIDNSSFDPNALNDRTDKENLNFRYLY